MSVLVLGVDPDLGGALAFLDRDTGELVELLDMPILQLKAKRELDVCQLAVLADDWACRVDHAFVEKSMMRPGQGVGQTWLTAFNYGAIVGVLRAQFLLVSEVAPATWKRAMRVTADKDESRKEASVRFPTECRRWALKKHHGRAEATLIAEYGRLHLIRHAEAA